MLENKSDAMTREDAISLKEYVDLRMSQERELRQLQITATEKALLLAKDTTEYTPKEWFETIHAKLETRVGSLEQSRSKGDGKVIMLMAVVTVINILIAIVAWLRPHV